MEDKRNHKIWRLAELIQTTAKIFEKNHIDNARLNAELLLGATLDMQRVDLYVNYNRPMSVNELNIFRDYVKRRISHEPLQYIVGETEFMSLNFRVTPDVLIPRADTETLVEWVIEEYQAAGNKRILDLGAGSGNIAVSLVHYLSVQVTAVDISLPALQVASENVRNHHEEQRVHLLAADFSSSSFSRLFKIQFDAIVSNPPYIPKEQYEFLSPEVSKREPFIALLDERSDGFYYKQIAQLAPELLNKNGTVYVELGYEQDEYVTAIFRQNGFSNLKIKKDLAGIPRVLRARKA